MRPPGCNNAGLGTTQNPSNGAMKPGGFPENAHREFRSIREGHFWFQSRKIVLKAVIDGLSLPGGSMAAEVGCGDGHLLELLPGRCRLGIEISHADLICARELWSGPLIEAAAEQLPLRKQLSLICAFDLLEHLPDARPFLQCCFESLEPAGWLMLTVPSDPRLWSVYDVFAGHCRRYTRATLAAVVEAAGFKTLRIFPLFRTLWPLVWLRVKVGSNHPISNPARDYSVHPLANGILRFLLRLEWRLAGMASLGTGTSWCMLARK